MSKTCSPDRILEDGLSCSGADREDQSTEACACPNFHARMRATGRWFLVSDICALVLSYLGGLLLVSMWHWIKDGDLPFGLFGIVTPQSFAFFWIIGAMAVLWLDSREHYRQRLPYWESIGHILAVASAGFVICGFIEFASRNYGSRLWTAFCWILFAAFSMFGRSFVRRRLRKAGKWNIPALVIGQGPTAFEAVQSLAHDKYLGFTIVDQLPATVLEDMKKTRAWKQMLVLHDAHYVFLALEGSEIERHQTALQYLPRARVPCSIVPPWLGLPTSTMTPHHFIMKDIMLLHDSNRLTLPLPRFTKRAVDIVISAVALLVLAPFFPVVAAIIRRDGGPAFFRQSRVGRAGVVFECLKFRSMRVDAEGALADYLAGHPEAVEEWNTYQKLKDDVRITSFGRFLRRTSIDEIPQLINVLRGDMSLVGPRPCLVGQEEFYAEDLASYEAVRPGITGPWQVSGRNQLSFKDRVNLEAWYARNWSLWLDIVIMLKTVPTLLRRGQAF